MPREFHWETNISRCVGPMASTHLSLIPPVDPHVIIGGNSGQQEEAVRPGGTLGINTNGKVSFPTNFKRSFFRIRATSMVFLQVCLIRSNFNDRVTSRKVCTSYVAKAQG